MDMIIWDGWYPGGMPWPFWELERQRRLGPALAALSTYIVPVLRTECGDADADAIARLVDWLDRKIVLTESVVEVGRRALRERVLRFSVRYLKTGPTTANSEIVATIRTGPVKAKKIAIVQEGINLDEVPLAARQQLSQAPTGSVEDDVRDDLLLATADKPPVWI